MAETNETTDKVETNKTSNKMLPLIIIAVLLIITGGFTWWYLSNRTEVPEDAIVVVNSGSETALDINSLSLSDFSGTVVNGKGEKKDVSGQGVKLSYVIGTADYSEVTVTADDEFSATVKKEEIDNAWLEIKDGTATLFVFGDENSKRNVKNAKRIEVK